MKIDRHILDTHAQALTEPQSAIAALRAELRPILAHFLKIVFSRLLVNGTEPILTGIFYGPFPRQ